MNWIIIPTVLLTFIYAGLISIFSADYRRLDNPVNLLLLLVGVALMIGGVFVSFWIFMQPEPTY